MQERQKKGHMSTLNGDQVPVGPDVALDGHIVGEIGLWTNGYYQCIIASKIAPAR